MSYSNIDYTSNITKFALMFSSFFFFFFFLLLFCTYYSIMFSLGNSVNNNYLASHKHHKFYDLILTESTLQSNSADNETFFLIFAQNKD